MTSILRASGAGQNHDRFDESDRFAMAGTFAIRDGGGSDIPDISAGQKMLSATSGSLLTSLLVTPLDVVRVRLQSQSVSQPVVDFSKLALKTTSLNPVRPSDLGVTACCREVFFMNNNAEYCLAIPKAEGPVTAASLSADCAVEDVQRRNISSTMDGLKKIARNEGALTLWRGLSPTLVMAVPANIIYFTGYDWLRYNAKSPISTRVRDEFMPLVAGTVARVLAATAVSPIELFRTRLQATSGGSASGTVVQTFRGVQDMVGTHGYRSLWRGLTLTLWRDVPFSGIYWWGYETIRGKLTDFRERRRGRTIDKAASRGLARRRSQSRENHADTFLDSFAAGATSGAIASILTMPFDVGKTRTQVFRDGPKQLGGAVSAATAPEERSMIRLLWHIFKNEGIAGLWKGWIPRTLKVAPACAIMISSYEVSKRVFRGVNERSRRGDAI